MYKKTKIIVGLLRKGGRFSINDFWFYADFLIEVVNSFHYFALILSYTGKFSCARQYSASRGMRAKYTLRNIVSPRCKYTCIIKFVR